ncbi:MAG: hypothetical protein Q9214_003154 [Letrouitia sp. 1 TL-2023]
MDPLSLTASVIAVAGLAAKTGIAFNDLRTACKTLPGRLHALSNEVVDIELVLRQVAVVVDKREKDPLFKDQQANIPHLLKQARTKLDELRSIVDKLIEVSASIKIPLFRVAVWRKDKPKLLALQEDIKTVKCSLNVMLGASNSDDMTRIRVDLKAISMTNNQSSQEQTAMHEQLQTSFLDRSDDLKTRIDQRLDAVEELLKAQSAQLENNQYKQLGPFYRRQASYIKQRHRLAREKSEDKSSDSVGVQVTRYTACRPGCSCACHLQRKTATPGFVDRVIGQMFVGYSGLPLLNRACDTEICEKAQGPSVSVEYWFPMGFLWSQIVRLQLSYQSQLGPQVSLSSLRRVPDSAQCVNFALNGNVDGLKKLFVRGLASPRDVSSTRGYSVLRWAMYGRQYQTCKFLVNAGADPDYRPIAASDNSPRNKAHQALLMGDLSRDDEEALMCLTQGSDFISDQNYTKLHKIVLGLSTMDLEEEILKQSDQVNATDIMGRTALAWAACRGDDRAIVTLLRFGAKVNTLDVQNSAPVCHAADRDHAICVRLLLEAGADPDIAAALGHKVGGPLNCAARNAADPLVLKGLLDFDANPDASGVDGMTALIHASRRDMAGFALLLLEYGADINAMSVAGQTPLTTAITYNSHNILKLLLDRWFEYTECPRLRGPNLLQIVALYADIETMSILSATDHLLLKYDKDYGISDFMSRLRQRPDATEKLIAAFEELLDVIKKESCSNHGAENLMESGLAPADPTNVTEVIKILDQISDPEDSDDEFENALEHINTLPNNHNEGIKNEEAALDPTEALPVTAPRKFLHSSQILCSRRPEV